LRLAISLGRVDVCNVLLAHGASALSTDRKGLILDEALPTDKADIILRLMDLFADIVPETKHFTILQFLETMISAQKFSGSSEFDNNSIQIDEMIKSAQ
jgi:hypothetical protein